MKEILTWEESHRNVEERPAPLEPRAKRRVEGRPRSRGGGIWIKKPQGTEPSDTEVRAALETLWGRNYYAQLEFLDCHVLNEDEIKSGDSEEAELRFEFIRPDDKPMIVVWDNEEECLFIDPVPIPLPLYTPRFGSSYPRSIGHRVQFSLFEFGKPWDNNYIYSTERLLEPKGNKLRVFRHNVKKFAEERDKDYILIHDYRQIISYVKNASDVFDSGYNLGKFVKGCGKLIDANIKKRLEWTDELMCKFLLHSIVQETAGSQMGGEYVFNSVEHNSRYQIGIIDDKIVSLDIGLRLGPNVLGHYVGKYDKAHKYLVDGARFAFYKSALQHGYLYINDGSDLDDPGLRQLKRKFYPVKVIDLYEYDPEGDTATQSPNTPPSKAIHTRDVGKDTPAPDGSEKST